MLQKSASWSFFTAYEEENERWTNKSSLVAGLFIIYVSLCFFTIEGLEFIYIFTHGGREFGRYPFSVYGKSNLCETVFSWVTARFSKLE